MDSLKLGANLSKVIMAAPVSILSTVQVAKKALDVFFEAFVGAFRTWRPDERLAGELLCHVKGLLVSSCVMRGCTLPVALPHQLKCARSSVTRL